MGRVKRLITKPDPGFIPQSDRIAVRDSNPNIARSGSRMILDVWSLNGSQESPFPMTHTTSAIPESLGSPTR
jgi:hypothetical protein